MSGAESPACHDEVCITCSDQAVEVRIRALLPGELAVVDTDAGPETVSVALVGARVGDVVVVHAKEAIACLPGGRPETSGAGRTSGTE